MSKLSRTAALEYISNWSTNDVVEVLKKNGLDDLCQAVLKRQIDGEELLHLTEGKLALWKSDLSRTQTWSLWTFVEDINRAPEEYVVSTKMPQPDPETVSDSGSWGTDFEDEEDDDDTTSTNANKKNPVLRQNDIPQRSTDFRNSLMMFQQHEKAAQTNSDPVKFPKNSSPNESVYMNCGSEQDADNEENAYMNLEPVEDKPPARNVSQLHNKFEKSLAEQLKAQLRLRCPETSKKREINNDNNMVKPSRKSFLHTNSAPNLRINDIKESKKPAVPPPRPEKCPPVPERRDDLPKPPLMIRNFDLVANLPITKTNESDDDEYEAFDEDIIEQNRQKMESKHSLIQGSVESVYKPSSSMGQEKEEDYEIYECITENPDDHDYYIQPISPPHLKEPSLSLSSPSITMEQAQTFISTTLKPQNKTERSPDKKSATLPHSGSSTSLSAEMRATRPLPPTPFGQSYLDSSWYHNVTREQATVLIKERAHSNAQNGYFLLRPSTSDSNSPIVLVLWFKDRVYNVPVRKRPDGRFALGFVKANEQSFTCVEDIIKFYLREELVLYSGGVQMGSTKLTDTPPKMNH